MSEETESEPVENEPIDADFEPASLPDTSYQEPTRAARGPGWLALGVSTLLAAGVGGVLGAGLMQVSGQFAPGSIADEIETVSSAQQTADTTLNALRTDMSRLGERLDRELQAAAASQGDTAAMDSLAGELERLSLQIEALETAQEAQGGSSSADLAPFIARLEALETADEDEVTSPRLANRAISALRRRVEEIEAGGAFDTRIEALETALTELQTAADTSTENNSSIDTDALVPLIAEMNALKAGLAAAEEDRARLVNELAALQSSEASSRQLLEQAAQRTLANSGASSAVLAILSIEAAARDGRPFQAAYAQLTEALPGNTIVQQLAPIAPRGAPTLATLIREFETARDAALAVRTDTEPSANSSGWGWVRQALGDSVDIRRSGDLPDGLKDTLSKAEAALTERDLVGTIGELESLSGPARDAVAPWVTRAQARVTLEDSLDQLRLALMNAEQ